MLGEEKKRKMKFNNKDAARFDKKKVKCYKCSELGHFARECTGKQLDSKARYSSFKLKELDKSEEPKALLSVDSMLNWSDHEGEDVEMCYGVLIKFALWVSLLGLNLKKLNERLILRSLMQDYKQNGKESSKNLDKLINSSMSSRSKFGLGFRDTFGSDEVFDLSAPSIFDSSPKDVAEKPLYDSDKSSDSETTGFASCVSSVKSSSSKTNEPLASAPSSVDFKTVSETADQQPSSTNDDSSFSFKENVKPPRNLYCDFYEKQLELHNKPMWNNVANIPSFVPKAASVPAGSRNRPTSVPAGSRNRPTSCSLLGLGQEWYFDIDYLTDSLGYTSFKSNQLAGTQDPNIHAGTQDDSDSECDDQEYGFPMGKIDSAAGVSYGPTETSTPVFKPVHTDATSLPPGHSLGSSEHSTRYPSPSGLTNSMSSSSEMEDIHHHPDTGIFSSSSYDYDFGGTVTNLAPSVVVNSVPTKRVNTIHPQSQILRDLTSPVQTRGLFTFVSLLFSITNLNKQLLLKLINDLLGMSYAEEMESLLIESMEFSLYSWKNYIGQNGFEEQRDAQRLQGLISVCSECCSRHPGYPLTSNLNAVKKIFKYLNRPNQNKVMVPRDSTFVLESYSDSDMLVYGDRKSTTGGCQFLGRRLIHGSAKSKPLWLLLPLKQNMLLLLTVVVSSTYLSSTSELFYKTTCSQSAKLQEPCLYGTRRKSLGARKKSSTELDLTADDRSFIRVLSDDSDDSNDDDDPPIFWPAFAAWEVGWYPTGLGDVNALYFMDNLPSTLLISGKILHLVVGKNMFKLYEWLFSGMVLVFEADHQQWVIRSWRIFPIFSVRYSWVGDIFCKILYMFADTPYPLSAQLMKKMLKHKLEAEIDGIGNDMTYVEQLIQFIKN
ncbi:putative ribonuclease H-like domain-containing protein [Tanacetum coccineum]